MSSIESENQENAEPTEAPEATETSETPPVETPAADAPVATEAAEEVHETVEEVKEAAAEAAKPTRKRGTRKRKEKKVEAKVKEAETAFDKLLKITKDGTFYGEKPKNHHGPKGKKESELKEGVIQLDLPTRLQDRTIAWVTLRWTPPAKGKWLVQTSARAARWYHLVPAEGQPGAGKTACQIPTHSWMGVETCDKAKTPITCPFCLARALKSGLVTEDQQRKVHDGWVKRKAQAAAKAEKEKAAASTKATADKATAKKEPEAKPAKEADKAPAA